MIDRDELTARLQREVTTLVDDLRTRADEVDEVGDVVREQWSAAVAAERTAHDMETWREGLLTQVAVSWVLGCVFIRFCEDNRLVTAPMISGRDEWRRWARDNQVAYFREHPEHAERHYLLHVFGQAAELPGLGDVFGDHNPLWQFGPSADAARDLIDLWRATDPETGELLWDFTDASWNTRFLGDLYQDLSEHAKKMYALLQTPDFVEEFILDRTLDPALDEFGLAGPDGSGFRMIDPACGSGHFLLGAFDRLATRWLAKEPAAGARSAAAKALDSVFGVDLNPFAASIARFRLFTAALRFADVKTLAEAPNLNIHVAVGDSLLHGTPEGQLANVGIEAGSGSAATRHLYDTEDRERVTRYLDQRYHAVVANPPYIAPADPAARVAYRARYRSCRGRWVLSVPFMERLFQLAIDPVSSVSSGSAGFVGQITSNTFMQREFGQTVVEEFLAVEVNLTHVIDTSLPDIPGHNQTVILLGRKHRPDGSAVRAALGIAGDKNKPSDPAEGEAWKSIVDLIDSPGSENRFLSVRDVDRASFATHPWSLQGGAAGPLKSLVERQSEPLEALTLELGIAAVTGEDEAFVVGSQAVADRWGLARTRRLVTGDEVREWSLRPGDQAIWSYDDSFEVIDPSELEGHDRWMWPNRAAISRRKRFGTPMLDRGLSWHEWQEVYPKKLSTPLSIVFAEVATHNHFVLDRGGPVFKQTAPLMKLRAAGDEEAHLRLVGVLNSSVACFWLKQVCYRKVSAHGGGVISQPDTHMYAFNASSLKEFPVPPGETLPWARALDACAQELNAFLRQLQTSDLPTLSLLDQLGKKFKEKRALAVALQEELDWRCMYLYGVTSEDLSFEPDRVFGLAVGQRAFEVALARDVAAGRSSSTWLARRNAEPTTELPNSWPDWYRERVLRRLSLAEEDQFVGLLERPEYKRRWEWVSWEDLAAEALRNWLLSRLEDGRYWPSIEPRSIAQLADIARGDGDFVQVAQLYQDGSDVDLVDLLSELAKSDAVPFLAAWRYKDSGMRKRAAWERTWDLQRQEDRGVNVGKIPLPPKYGLGDFRVAVSWKLRGKLDVPRERFVEYPDLGRDNDAAAVIGWAGWDHLQQAQALAGLYQQRRDTEGWPTERLVPILAGLQELVPWLQQWHNDIDPDIGQGLGDYYADYLAAEMQRHGVGVEDLASWRPPVKQRGRKKAAKKADT